MTVYKTDGLTPFQNFHRRVFQCPEGSLSHWGVKKIEYCYRNERTKIHDDWAHTARRIIALAMPVFNLLDMMHYIPMAAYKFATLKPKDGLYDLLKCLKCLQVFSCAIPTLLVAVIEPKLVYRTEGMWLDVKNAQMKTEITRTFEKMKAKDESGVKDTEHLKAACEKAIDKMVGHDEAAAILKKVLGIVISEIPTDDPEKQEIITEQYIEIFSELLVCSAHQQVELDKMTEHFSKMLELIIKVRNPLLRLSLIHIIVTTAKDDPETYRDIVKQNFENNNRQVLPYMIARLFTDDEDLLAKLLEVSKGKFFKKGPERTLFVATLHEIYQSELKKFDKEKALSSLLDSFVLDQKIAEAEKPVKRNKGDPTNSEDCDLRIEKKRNEIRDKEKKRDSLDKNRKKREIFKLNNQIKKLEKEIAALEKLEFKSEDEILQLKLLKKESGSHFESAQDILRMLLSLNDQDLVSNCIKSIGSGKTYPRLSDERIVTDIFKIVFELEDLPADAFQRIQELRAPWALVAFHGRLRETSGKYRTDLIRCNKAIVQSLLEGTYDKLRHEPDTNPTLKKVFEAMPDLKNEWMYPSKSFIVKNLTSSKRFGDFRIVEATDPSDILLIGNDTHTCVHLGGRIERVAGMSAFIRDGKIHTLLIKNEEGITVAETQLLLLWDKKNKKPVLFVEQANFMGAKNKDFSLERAIYAYAKERAKELNLNLVTCYKMKDPKSKLMSSKKYNGKVASLGSSSPLEYVNRFFKNISQSYDLGQTCLVAMD